MVQFDENQIVFASLGGLILGLATSLNYAVRGKVTGMSGIAYGIVSLNKSQIPEKISIIGGMLFISSVFYLIFGNGYYNGFEPFGPQNQIDMWTTFPGFVLAGLFVGFGTKLGNGCTSGHGLCGIPRFSLRSIVAVCIFLTTGIAVSTFGKNVGLWPFATNQAESALSPQISYNHQISSIIFLVIGLFLPAIGFYVAKQGKQFNAVSQILDQLLVFVVGVIFAVGLMISGMSRRLNILQFLQINSNWNPALMFVLCCGLLVNTITFTFMRKRGTSFNGNKVFDPISTVIDWQLVGGAFCFGVGWGIGGLCPGPFFVLFSVFTVPVQILWGIGMVMGMVAASKIAQIFSNSPKQNNLNAQIIEPLRQEEQLTAKI